MAVTSKQNRSLNWQFIFAGTLVWLWHFTAASSPCPPETSDRVLILYDSSGSYGWIGELHAKELANLLGHFPLAYQISPVEDYHAGDLGAFRAAFYLGTVFNNSIPADFAADVLAARKPVCWFKYNLWKLGSGMPFESKFGFRFEFIDMSSFSTIGYKGETFSKHPADPDMGRVTILNPLLTDVPALAWQDLSSNSIPYIVRGSNLWYVADSPFSYTSEEDRYLVFADLLHDILQISHPEIHLALIRLEDIDPTYPTDLLQRAAGYLSAESVPFGVAVVPVYSDPLGRYNGGIPEQVPMSDAPQFVATLKSMISQGGQIVMHGYTHQYDAVPNPATGATGDDYEFFRVTTNGAGSVVEYRPLPEDSMSWVVARLRAGLQEFEQAGLTPVAWETPHYAASALDYQVFAANFSLTMQRVIYFDRTENYIAGQFFPYFIQRDTYGQRILPENLGNIDPTSLPTSPPRLPADLIRAARKNRVLRDAYASAFFHPYLDLSYLQELVSGIKALGYTFVPLSRVAPFAITGMNFRAGTLRFSFPTENGLTYSVEYKGRLSDAVWLPLTTLSGDGCMKQVSDVTGPAGLRFYRVRVE